MFWDVLIENSSNIFIELFDNKTLVFWDMLMEKFGDILIMIASVLMLFSGGKHFVKSNLIKIIFSALFIIIISVLISPWLAIMVSLLIHGLLELSTKNRDLKTYQATLEKNNSAEIKQK